MRVTRQLKITSAAAACAVGALALTGGTYATLTAFDTAAGQVITSAYAGLRFTDDISTGAFEATYSNLAAGDSQVSYINLKNDGTISLEGFRISQVSTGSGVDTMGTVDDEGFSIQVDRVSFGPDGSFGGGDDTLAPVVAKVKLATLLTKRSMLTGPVAAAETAHLKFTVTMDPLAVVQDQALRTVYKVDADQVIAP